MIDGFEAVRQKPLSRAELAFFTDAVEKARAELSIKSYQLGLDHMRTGRWHEAATAFEEAIKQKETAAHTLSARLNLARVPPRSCRAPPARRHPHPRPALRGLVRQGGDG